MADPVNATKQQQFLIETRCGLFGTLANRVCELFYKIFLCLSVPGHAFVVGYEMLHPNFEREIIDDFCEIADLEKAPEHKFISPTRVHIYHDLSEDNLVDLTQRLMIRFSPKHLAIDYIHPAEGRDYTLIILEQ